MAYKFDYPEPGTVVTWTLTPDGVERVAHEFYPTFYVHSLDHGLDGARELLEGHPLVESLQHTRSRPGWRHDERDVLEVAASSLAAVDELGRTLAQEGRPGTFRLYNVDFNREFRYCLETNTSPLPARTPTVLRLSTPELTFADGQALTELQIDDEQLTGPPTEVADEVSERIAERDPDVLQVSTADLIPLLFEATTQSEDEFSLGRAPGYQTLAGSSTVLSYGQVGNSPARYNVPGRAIVDESNTFWLRESNLDGILDLVERSHKPLQETAWGSIGNILTAIQIRYARKHDVLVPWRSWRHERFKSARTLNEADRGGFTFAPNVGVHDDVHELDFSSLYPNIIRECNISPETVRCDCHTEREDVPGLGYSICPEPGYLPEVLGPLIDDRDDIKTAIKESDDPDVIEALEGQSSAIKWILVSCFGYQGFANAKFGRIECHEAINAYAREIILDAKHLFEQHGWQIIHGIVDSLWVKPLPDCDPSPLDAVADEITQEVGVRLEYEAQYDSIAFCPRRTDDAGALTRYFGKKRGEPIDDTGSYKYRGIEVRQRSTPAYFERVQQELIQTYARTRDPETVVDQLQGQLQRLDHGDIPAADLIIKNRVSKPVDEYTQSTRNVAALYRSRDQGLEKVTGENVEYVVVDDEKSGRERVQLRSEGPTTYDPGFYKTELIRVAESVLSPMGWKRDRIEDYLADRTDGSLSAYH